MALLQKDVNAARPPDGARPGKTNGTETAEPQRVVTAALETLTFITSDGETIAFDGMDIPVGEAAALAGEEALGRIWNRPEEDLAWRGI